MTRAFASGFAASLLLSSAAIAHAAPEFSFTESDLPDEGAVVVFVGEDGDLSAGAEAIDAATGDRLSAVLEAHDFAGTFGQTMHFKALAPFDHLVVIGTGEETLAPRHLADLGGHAAAALGEAEAVLVADDLETDVDDAAAFVATGYALRSYRFTKYKSDHDAQAKSPEITLYMADASDAEARFTRDHIHLIEGVSLARDLGTEPGNTLWPQTFVERVRPYFRGVSNIEIDVLDARDLEREGMGAILGVGQGSIHDPRLMVIRYQGDRAGVDPIALVGKGVTFDTGGISLKPNTGMWYMKSDLSGAAAVAGAILSAAKRGEQINVVGYLPLAENMPARDAIRPGDVLTTMGGKTIEVMNTDAEGRLLLADAVQYAQAQDDPELVLTIATLTGSAGRALGTDYAAIVTREFEASETLMETGDRAGEDVWPLPLNDNHFKAIQSDIADIKSTGGRPGASIGAAVVGTFIEEDQPWVHLDIAGVDWLDSPRPTTPKGHAGWGVRFLDQMLRETAED